MPEPSFTFEQPDLPGAVPDTLNVQLLDRYSSPESTEKHNYFQQQIEQVLFRTMEKQVSLLGGIDDELKALGLSTEGTTSITKDEFLKFVLSDTVIDLTKSRGKQEGVGYTVEDDYTIVLHDNAGGEPHAGEIYGGPKVALLGFLAQRGVDVIHEDDNTLRELFEGRVLDNYTALTKAVDEGSWAVKEYIEQERSLYSKELKQELRTIVEEAKIGSLDSGRLAEVFTLYQHISMRFKEEECSFIPDFEALVASRRELSPENNSILSKFFEKNEELVFEVLGEDYFFDKVDYQDSYGSAYKAMFGYSGKEIWERRRRNWTEVNKYIVEEIADRGYLTVDDLRRIHDLSMYGVLPYFCRGLRTDRFTNMFRAEKRNVAYTRGGGREFGTTKAGDLEGSLDLLVSKANRVVKARYPQVFTEVAWGNLFAEYSVIHPHTDGNGTNAVFFIEALKVLRGNYTPPEHYEEDYLRRVKTTLNGNLVALSTSYLRLSAYEHGF